MGPNILFQAFLSPCEPLCSLRNSTFLMCMAAVGDNQGLHALSAEGCAAAADQEVSHADEGTPASLRELASEDVQSALAAATAHGDIDEVRRLARQMLAASGSEAKPKKGPPRPAPDARKATEIKMTASSSTPSSKKPRENTSELFGLTLSREHVMGEVIWPAALCLCRWLEREGAKPLRVLELGAGGGAPGLLVAALGSSSVVLTDGDAGLLPLLTRNLALNRQRISCDVHVHRLDWRSAESVRECRSLASTDEPGFDTLLAADVLFSVGDIVPMARAVAALLRRHADASLLFAHSYCKLAQLSAQPSALRATIVAELLCLDPIRAMRIGALAASNLRASSPRNR